VRDDLDAVQVEFVKALLEAGERDLWRADPKLAELAQEADCSHLQLKLNHLRLCLQTAELTLQKGHYFLPDIAEVL
jgi:hypothetical protein